MSVPRVEVRTLMADGAFFAALRHATPMINRHRVPHNGDADVAPVPEPASVLLLGTGLALGAVSRRRARRSTQ